MKRILLFIDSLGSGGAQRQIVGLAGMLRQRSYEIKIIFYHNDLFYQNELEKVRVSYEYIKTAENKFKRISSIHNTINRFNPDCLIAFLDTPCIISCIDKFFFRGKYKLIVSERNTTQKITFREKIKFRLFNIANYIVPNAYSQENFIKKHFPTLSPKVITINNFVDSDHFKREDEHVRNLTTEFIVAATLWPSKNALGLIEALKIVKDKGYKCRIKWYGRVSAYEDYVTQCEVKIKEYGLEDYIFLYDKTLNIKQQYLKSDYFCLPSFYEGTPNVICEAMACSLPILCSDVCDNGIYVKEGINGFLFNPQLPESIAQKIICAIEQNQQQYDVMAHNSRDVVEKLLSKSSFIEKYIKLLN